MVRLFPCPIRNTRPNKRRFQLPLIRRALHPPQHLGMSKCRDSICLLDQRNFVRILHHSAFLDSFLQEREIGGIE